MKPFASNLTPSSDVVKSSKEEKTKFCFFVWQLKTKSRVKWPKSPKALWLCPKGVLCYIEVHSSSLYLITKSSFTTFSQFNLYWPRMALNPTKTWITKKWRSTCLWRYSNTDCLREKLSTNPLRHQKNLFIVLCFNNSIVTASFTRVHNYVIQIRIITVTVMLVKNNCCSP